MKKHAMIKRILSAFLAIVLVVGMITVSESKDVEAANTNVEIDFASVDGGGNWSFSVNGLPSNAAQYYRFVSVEVDGAVQENTVWMEISGGNIVIWNGGCDNGMPSTSLKIPAGTVLKEADPWTVVAGGQTLTITNELYVVNNNGTWAKQNLSSVSEIQMDFVSVDNGGNWSFSATGLPNNAAQYYRFASVEVDGTVQENTVWMEISGGNIVIWNGGCDNGMPTTSLKIPAGTVLKEADPWTVVAGGQTLIITNDLYIVNNNGTWEKQIQSSANEIQMDFVSVDGGGNWSFSVSGLPSNAAQYYRFASVEVDGTVQENTVWMEISGGNIVIWNGGCDNGMPSTSLKIPAGTVLKEADPWTVVAGGQTLTITNELYVVNNNGVWEKQTLSSANEIQMDFVSVDGGGNWSFNVSGLPNNAAQYYRFASVEVDGTVQENTVWMEISGGNIVIWNGGCDNGMPTTSLKIPAGTVLKEADPWTVVAGGQTLTITNELYVVNNNGTWEKQSASQPTSVEVELGLDWVSGNTVALTTDLGNNALNEIYGSVPDATGSIYVDGNECQIAYALSSGQLVIWNLPAEAATASKMEIREGLTLTFEGKDRPLVVKNTLKFEKSGNTWVLDDGVDTTPVEVELGLDWISGSTVALTTDLGNNALNEIYGSVPDATGSIYVDGNECQIAYALSSGQLVIWNLPAEAATASKMEIREGLTLTFEGKDRPLVVKNTLKFKKHNGNWVIDTGVEDTVIDCQVTAYELWPNQSADYCQVVAKTDVDLQALYPDQAVTGKIKIGDVEKVVTWYIGTNLIYTVGITYDEFMTAESMTIETDSVFELTTDPTKKVKFTKGLELINKSGTWISSDVNVVNVPISDYELWRKGEFYQLIIKSTTDLRPVTNQPISGYVYIDGNKKQVEWYVDESTGAVYTVGITLKEGDSAKRIQIPKDSLFTILNDSANVLEITKALKLIQIDGIWMQDKGQKKIDYNEVKVSFSSSDGRGFYLNAEIISGPDKGKDIGGEDVYGNWLTTATGAMSYNGNSTVDVFWSPTEKMIYISGDYDPSTMTSIQLKKGTVLRPAAGAPCSTMMRLANDLNLAFDARYDRWVLAGNENKQYTFNDVKVGVARVTGVELELQGTFTKMSNKKLMDVYGDWVNLVGKVILGDPDRGTYTNNGVAFSLAGTSLIIYGIQPGLMDTIEIKKGTILWPDSSCKSQNPIRIVNDILMIRDSEDEWVIKAGKMTTKKNVSQGGNTAVQSEQKDVVEETLASYDDGPTKVRLVDADGDDAQDGKEPVVSGNIWGYIGTVVVGVFAVALITGLILFLKKRKKDEEQTVE